MTDAALAARLESASRRLDVAIRLDLNRFVADAVESRLRARPNFLARTPQAPLVGLRNRVDGDAAQAAEALSRPVADLRAYYGAESRTADEEDRGFVKTVGEAAVADHFALESPLAAAVEAEPAVAVGNIGPFGEGGEDSVIHEE